MSWFSRVDTALFMLINNTLSSYVLDVIMPFITDKSHLIIPAVILIILVIIRHKSAEIRTVIVLILTILMTDFTASVLKDIVMRVRPCHAIDGVHLLTGCGGSYSFPSNHAANITAAMVFLSLRYRKYTPLFLFFAAAVSYSRVYVGVHYPIDVIGGALLGTLLALIFHLIDKKGLKTLKKALKH